MKKIRAMRCKCFLLFTAFLTVFTIMWIPAARADRANVVQLKASIGFNGQYKWNTQLPIKISVSNSSTKPVNGAIKLVLRNHSSLNGAYVKPLTLAGGETKQIVFPFTGPFNSNNDMDLSYAEWVQDGAPTVKQALSASGVPADFLAGILADKAAASSLLQTQPSSKQAPSIGSVQLAAEDIPTDSLYDASLDALFITKDQYSLLSNEQKIWIDHWKADGGVLITVDHLAGAAAWKNLNEAVVQARQSRTPMSDNSFQLSNIASHIPGIDQPSVPLLILLFVVYILIIGPVLYFVLKKQNRQEWTWAAVPAAALITALLIFGYGKWQHGNTVLQQSVDILHIKNNDSTDVESASAFFVPSGGDYTLRINKTVNLFPVNESINSQTDSESRQPTVTLEPQKSSILFPNTSFWSLHKAFITDQIHHTGSFTASLVKGTSRIAGTFRNGTIYALHDVRLVYGDAIQSIPVLAPGAETQVNLPVDSGRGKQPPFDKLPNASLLLPSTLGTKTSESMQSPEEQLINLVYNESASPNEENPSISIIGWTDQHPYSADMAGAAYKTSRLTLVESRIGVNGVGVTK